MGIVSFLLNLIISIFSRIIGLSIELIDAIFSEEKDHSYKAEFGKPGEQLSEVGGFRVGYEYGNSLIASNQHSIIFGDRKSVV